VILDGDSLTLEAVVNVARFDAKVELSRKARERIEKSHSALEESIRKGKTIYGVTTGFGALSNTRITTDQTSRLQTNLLRSHAAGVGENLPSEVVRAMMLLRLNTFAKGHSAIRTQVAELIASFLNSDVDPVIPSKGSVGASGDLAPLSHMALALMGEGNVEFRGRVVPASEAIHQLGLTAIQPEMKEGLALNNGTQMSTAVASLTVYDSVRLLKAAEISAALSIEALRGFTQPYDQRIHSVRPFKGQSDSAYNLRLLTANSRLMKEQVEGDKEPVQDAYSLRCTPQVMGAAREAVYFARGLIEVELNSATDNPLVFTDGPDVLSGGNFHGQVVGMATDIISIALSTVANLSERRTFRLLDSTLSGGLPPFLVGAKDGAGLHSGLMAVQYTAAALASENKVLAHPATVDTIPTSGNMEDFVSMSPTAGLKARKILENSETVVAIELLCAAQALDFFGHSKAGRGSQAAYRKIREIVPALEEDRPLSKDIEAVRKLVSDGTLIEAVESQVGKLK